MNAASETWIADGNSLGMRVNTKRINSHQKYSRQRDSYCAVYTDLYYFLAEPTLRLKREWLLAF